MRKILYKIENEKIRNSVIVQDIKSVKTNAGFDINWTNSQGVTLLIEACHMHRKELILHILTYPKINVNHQNKSGDTALHAICYNSKKNIPILKLLLNRKDLDVNIQDNSGYTGLHFVIYDVEMAKELLLDARINTSLRDKRERTAEDYARWTGHSGIAKILRNSRHTTLLRIPNELLVHDIVRMIIEEYT